MPISDSVRTSRRALDRELSRMLSSATVAISRCEELALRCEFSIVYAGRPLIQYRIDEHRIRSAEYRCRKTLPFFYRWLAES